MPGNRSVPYLGGHTMRKKTTYLFAAGYLFALCLLAFAHPLFSQMTPARGNDVTAPLHALQPDYPVPYSIPSRDGVTQVLERVLHYLDAVTPAQFSDRVTGAVVTVGSHADTNIVFKQGDFRLTSYEWGVTYAGMLLAGEATGDRIFYQLYKDAIGAYGSCRTRLPFFIPNPAIACQSPAPDDRSACAGRCGSRLCGYDQDPSGRRVCKAAACHRSLYRLYISTRKEFRLSDGTLARNRPQQKMHAMAG